MSDLKVSLPEAQVQEVVSAAVLKLFNEEQRDTLMQHAIRHLLTPEDRGRGYGRGRTPLEEAFDTAVNQATRQWFVERLTGDEDTPEKKMLHDALSQVVERMFTGEDGANVIDVLTEGVGASFRRLAEKARGY
jgi:hypothetical protein